MKQEHNYLTTKNSKVFPSILVIFLLIYVVEYVAVVAFNESPFSHPAMMDVSIAIVCSFWYLVRYRRFVLPLSRRLSCGGTELHFS